MMNGCKRSFAKRREEDEGGAYKAHTHTHTYTHGDRLVLSIFIFFLPPSGTPSLRASDKPPPKSLKPNRGPGAAMSVLPLHFAPHSARYWEPGPVWRVPRDGGLGCSSRGGGGSREFQRLWIMLDACPLSGELSTLWHDWMLLFGGLTCLPCPT